MPLVALGAIALFFAAGIVICVMLAVRHKIKILWLLLAVAFAAAALALCLVGSRVGMLYARPDARPEAAAEAFMEAVCAGDFAAAEELLSNYSSLGLDTLPETELGRMVHGPLLESYSYAFAGNCNVDMLEARQPVRFTFLDLAALTQAAAEGVPAQLEAIVDRQGSEEVYDEENNYLPEVTELAYKRALEALLENPEDFYSTRKFSLSLSYAGGSWQLIADEALLKALSGGI